mmetsp:Transcript_291/g.2335  ORF Transcript_291/g.2335 Transcript_291/m.2335 type:complete len:118 (-) Transcript_291:3329-3682(-)
MNVIQKPQCPKLATKHAYQFFGVASWQVAAGRILQSQRQQGFLWFASVPETIPANLTAQEMLILCHATSYSQASMQKQLVLEVLQAGRYNLSANCWRQQDYLCLPLHLVTSFAGKAV